MPKNRGTTIWVSNPEYALLAEGKELFSRFTGVKISWGAYLSALSIGALAAKAITGVLIRCPSCGGEVEMKLVKPRIEPLSPDQSGQYSEPRSQNPSTARARPL
jgi:hypothetical protein